MQLPTSPEARRWRTLVVVGVTAAALLALIAVGEGHLKAFLVHALSARSGRAVHVNGDLEVHLLSGHPAIRAHEVVVDNPSWVPPGKTAEMQLITVLLRWHWGVPVLQIRRVEIEGANLNLLRDAHGRANWQLHADGPGGGPPLVRSLSMPEAHVELHDALLNLEFEGTVSAGDEDATGRSPLLINGAGQLNGRAATFRVSGEPLAQSQPNEAYHFSVEERSGGTHLRGEGSFERPFDFRQMQLKFAVRGPDMADMYYLAGLKLPQTRAFELSARLVRSGARFEYTDLRASSGESDIAGSVREERIDGRAHIEAQLSSQRLRLADLDAAEAPAGGTETRLLEKLKVIPDTPLRVEGLRKADAIVSFRAHELEVGKLTLTDATGRVAIERGKLSVTGLQAQLAGGTLSGEVRLDASRALPRGSLDLLLSGAPLEQLKTDPAALGGLSGLLSVRAQLAGSGKSPREMAGTAEGTVTAVVPQGRVRAALPEAASLELAGALGLMANSQKTTAVRCAVASFEAHEGVLSARTVVFDTDKALITMTGDVNLDSQELDFTLRGHPKTPALALHSAVAVRGTLGHPQYRLAGDHTAAQAGVAATLGAALAPVAAVLAFVNPGLAQDADCAALLGSAAAEPPPAT